MEEMFKYDCGVIDKKILEKYEAIEKAVAEKKPVRLPIGTEIKVGDGIYYISDVLWRDADGELCMAMLQPEYRARDFKAGLYVVGSATVGWATSGDVSMFVPENRALNK